MLSDAVLVSIRPFESYAGLRNATPSTSAALGGPLGWLLTIACFVSWTTSGALLPSHLLLNPWVWLFAPLCQIAWLLAVARAVGCRSWRAVVALYYLGHFPWLALLLVVAGVCLLAPDPWGVLSWALEHHVLALVVLVTTGWCIGLTYALFRAGLGLTRRIGAIATTAFYLGYGGTLGAWFLVTGQLLPLWGIL